MARYGVKMISQTAQLTGVNATTTVNGYLGYLGGSATSGFRLRRVGMSCTFTGSITSQQIVVSLYPQTVAPAGTGLAAAVKGTPFETWTPADPTTGVIATTATTIGTTGPTITTGTGPLKTWTFNSQTWLDYPIEAYEEVVSAIGTANGLAFVTIGPQAQLPAGCAIVLDIEYEV
jgi:hypothetical protein